MQESKYQWIAAIFAALLLWGGYNQWLVVEMARKVNLIQGKVLLIAGKVAVTEGRCCCSWPGAGWYCVKQWENGEIETQNCANISCPSAQCTFIGTQEAWDTYQFGVCVWDGAFDRMNTTDGVKHASAKACWAAGCACE